MLHDDPLVLPPAAITLGILPFFLALALWAETPRRFRWLSTASLALLVFFTSQFVQNSWID